METRSAKLIFVAVTVVSLIALTTQTSAAGVEPHQTKADITAVIDDVARWYYEASLTENNYRSARQMMIELGNSETILGTGWFGKTPQTIYGYDNRFNIGWAQFGKGGPAGFEDVQLVFSKDQGVTKIKKRLDSLRGKQWEDKDHEGQTFIIDPLKVSKKDLSTSDYKSDLTSAIFLREHMYRYPTFNNDFVPPNFKVNVEYSAKVPENPYTYRTKKFYYTSSQVSTLRNERAWWWARWYNTGKEAGGQGKGSRKDYHNRNFDNSKKWVYAGTYQIASGEYVDKYYLMEDEAKYLNENPNVYTTAKVKCVLEETWKLGTDNTNRDLTDDKTIRDCPPEPEPPTREVQAPPEPPKAPGEPLPLEDDTEALGKTYHSSKKYVTAAIENVARWYYEDEIGGENYEGGYQHMIEIGNYKSGLGTEEGTYGTEEADTYGWIRLLSQAEDEDNIFKDFKDRFGWRTDRLSAIRKEWGFDPLPMEIDKLNELSKESDLKSAIILRETMLGDPDPIPRTLEARAEWWARREDRPLVGEANEEMELTDEMVEGFKQEYIDANTIQDNLGRFWVYAGTVKVKEENMDRYYLKAKEDETLSPATDYQYIAEGSDEFPIFACVRQPKAASGTICVRVTYDDDLSEPSAISLGEFLIESEQYDKSEIAIRVGDITMGEPNVFNYKGDFELTCEETQTGAVSFQITNPALDDQLILCVEITKIDEGGIAGIVTGEKITPVKPDEQVKPPDEQVKPPDEPVVPDEPVKPPDEPETIPVPPKPPEPEPDISPEELESIRSSISTMQLRELSTYMTRYYSKFNKSGTAYRILPTGLEFNKPINLTLKHEGEEFTHGDDLFIYRFEDEKIDETCNHTILGEVRKIIGEEGGALELGDARLEFPANSVTEDSEIIIMEMDLDCPERVKQIPDENVTTDEPIERIEGEFDLRDFVGIFILIVIVAIIALVLYRRKTSEGSVRNR